MFQALSLVELSIISLAHSNRIASRRVPLLLIGVVMIAFSGMAMIPTVSAAETFIEDFSPLSSGCVDNSGSTMFNDWKYYENDTDGSTSALACWNSSYTNMTKPEGVYDLSRVTRVYPSYLDMGGSSFVGVKVTAAIETFSNNTYQSIMLYFKDEDGDYTYHHFELTSTWQTFTIDKWDSWDRPITDVDWDRIENISVHGHDYDSGEVDPNGGYSIKWKDLKYITLEELTSDSPYSGSITSQYDSDYYKYDQGNGYYAVTGVRSSVDYDIAVYDDSNYATLLASSAYTDPIIDFVVVNYNKRSTQADYPKVYYGSGSTYSVEWYGGARTLSSGSNGPYTMSTSHVVDIWDVYLYSDKEYNFKLDITSGDCDLGMALYYIDSTPYAVGRSSYKNLSDSGGDGIDESFIYAPTTTGWHGFVVWNNDCSTNTDYNIIVTRPPTTPSTPSGPSTGTVDSSDSFSTSTTDPDGDNVAYRFDWGDGSTSSWTSFVSSGSSANKSHSYSSADTYYVKAQAKDTYGATSGWSTSGHEIVISDGGGECEGIVPGLVDDPDNPDVKNNYDANIYDTLHRLQANFATGFGWRIIDVTISTDVTNSYCASKVESILEEETDQGRIPLDPFPLPEVNGITYSGEYHFSTFDSKEFTLSLLLDYILGRIGATTPNPSLPPKTPDIYLMQTNITDTSNLVHPVPHSGKRLPSVWEGIELNIDGPFFVAGGRSPVDILVIDPKGQKVGSSYQNETLIEEINEIPSKAIYTGNGSEPEYVFIYNPEEGNYTIKIKGTEDGKYDLDLVTKYYKSTSFEKLVNISIIKNEEHIYYLEYGLQEARIYSLMYGTYYSPGETVSSKIYVENSGGVDIDDALVFVIIDPSGERIYKKRKPIYIEADETMTFKFDWGIPSDALKGHYWLRVEFDDSDIDFLPLTKSFWVD